MLADLHMDRLFDAIKTLQFQPTSFFTPAYITNLIHELVVKNQHQALARVRVTVFRGNGGIYDAINHAPNLLIQSWPLNPENNNLNENGLVLGLYDGAFKAADALANVKSNNYLLYAMAALYARQQHCNDVLVLNHRKTVADATIANLFLVDKRGAIVTPPLTDGGVAGVMRRHILSRLPSLGYTVLQQPVEVEQLAEAKAVFLTNAIYGIKWVAVFGNCTYERAIVQQLHRQLIEPLVKA
ncbi:MAG: hypothetical protein EAY75_14295 [Bacteroidetes bacterium]|nr:MAG: hypothetical protein EAY75_14295 [Bacteroidota bacterium]